MKSTTMTTQKQQKIKNRLVPNYSLLALSVMIILLLNFVNSVNADVDISLRGVCTADAGKIPSLKIGPAKNFDLQVSFQAKSYTRGIPVPITIDVNKDQINAMLIYAFGKGNDQFRVGSWDSSSAFNWDISCGSSQADQNSTVVSVGKLTTKTTLNWYPPNSSGNGDITFRALIVNDSGYELITTSALQDSTHTPVSTTSANTATTTIATKTSSNSATTPKASISRIDTYVPDNSSSNLDSSSFIVIMLSSTFLLLIFSFPLFNIIIL
ncbi:hypothetical protein Glove_126g8 [Diversispora epigaea]|uniref:Reelin domain-containing protein n=1 Tax=Diversispora epigaea TaxID=1348612 RepID=A0A397J2A4_9GLOM|nr:hypothetical protein Glove_126g8 [Diversispora epigaea]